MAKLRRTPVHTALSAAGFTLAELLIALAILGVIASFTIPKVLESSTSAKYTAAAKEAASMISGSFSAYKMDSSMASTVTAGAFTSYMNYVATDTDNNNATVPSGETAIGNCSTNITCLLLHNGGTLAYHNSATFGGTAATNAVYWNFDPDSTASGAGGVTFIQYYNGRLTTGANSATGTTTGGTQVSAIGSDPSWLSSWS
jgi:prepilin-type N-terminal cleavage/methylation domain-containing protein